MSDSLDEHLGPVDLLHLLWIAGRFPDCSQSIVHLVLLCDRCCQPSPIGEDDRRALSESHFTDESLGSLVWTILFYGNARLAAALEHLTRNCSGCWELAEPLFARGARDLSAQEAAKLAQDFHALVEVERQTLEEERADAPLRLEQLLEQPPQRRRMLVDNSSKFRTAPLVDALCRASLDAAPRDGGEAIQLAELALEAAQRLDSALYGRRIIQDLKALAHSTRGNALRVESHLAEADVAFEQAVKFQGRGSGQPALAAEIDSLRASLFATRRDFPAARRLLARARETFLELDDREALLYVLLKDAYVCREAGWPLAAVRLLDEVAPYVDERISPRLRLCAIHTRLVSRVEMGHHAVASRLLSSVRQISEESGTDLDRLRLDWVEGEIAAGLENLEHAERVFETVRKSFLERRQLIDAALVGMHLARARLRLKRPQRVQALIEDSYSVFMSHGMTREAEKAQSIN